MPVSALKTRSGLLALALSLSAWGLFYLPTSSAQSANEASSLIQQEGWQLVEENCTECHSTQIIMQNSGSREVWKSRITWMQETQGLGELQPAVENSILDYLAKNYGQRGSSRRAGISAHLLPDNPYPTTE